MPDGEIIHAPANEFETMCGQPVWDAPFAGHLKHITCPTCRERHPDAPLSVGVVCGNCGGNVLMATCDMFRGTGHESVLVSVCMICRAVYWIETGCEECNSAQEVENR